MSLEDIRNERIRKLNLLKEKGIEPYPVSVERDFSVAEILKNFSKLSKKKKPFFVVGRIMAMRMHGGAGFFNINDGSASIQAYIKKDDIRTEQFDLFNDTVDIGDFVELRGTLFITKTKEKTIKVSQWRIIAKSLRPLPEKWYGLQDIEEKFRKRYLDLLMNDEVKQRFLLRSKIISEIRNFLDKENFIEVETPILQHLAGGALAEPFKTHHNTLDMELYLRIAPELYLKKLLIGGFEKVYELGRNFRNEGIDATHNPEFTMIEVYEAYQDAEGLRKFIEKIIKALIKKLSKKNLKKFNTISYFDVLKRFALITDIEKASRDSLILKAQQFGIKVETFESREKIMDNIFKKICRPKIVQPTFVVDYPAGSSPLAKRKEGNWEMIDRFQLIIDGVEVANGFSELNDPIDQRNRFIEQDKAREKGEKEVSPSDEDYLEAMEYGMPPASGFGIGIDRLVMLLTNTHNIREVILFPILRPKDSNQ
ncbi:MAG: lysine--tRNA ligase [Candidatus Terrybacteria bacterium]|nr:lysine--tRNA ligase [Candidatus Terrybacteria bacterium]